MALITILAKVPRAAWSTLAILAILVAAYLGGARHKAAEIAAQDRKEYDDTTERIDRATGHGGDADAARGRLRDTLGPWPGDL